MLEEKLTEGVVHKQWEAQPVKRVKELKGISHKTHQFTLLTALTDRQGM